MFKSKYLNNNISKLIINAFIALKQIVKYVEINKSIKAINDSFIVRINTIIKSNRVLI